MQELKITDVRVVPGDSGFLIDDGETAILYDSGFGFTGNAMAEKIKKVLGQRKLDYIFLTHSHYDHALGSANILRSYPEAKVAAGRYAAGIFQRDGAKRVMRELDRKAAAASGIADPAFIGDELRVDICCDDGDLVRAGSMTFQVIELPGHTKCSIGYYCKERKLLLSSESLGVYDGGFTDTSIASAFLVSYEASLRSMHKVRSLEIDSILAPHVGILTKEQSSFFLSNMEKAAKDMAADILEKTLKGFTEEEMIRQYKDRFWKGYIKTIYPIDALEMNTSIMIKLIQTELGQ